MRFYYKTNVGHVGVTRDIEDVPKNCVKLIVKRYDGTSFELPYVEKVVIDTNGFMLSNLMINCDDLYVYRHTSMWFMLRTESVVQNLKKLNVEKITIFEYAFQDVCIGTIPTLDMSNVNSTKYMFLNSTIREIPKMVNYNHVDDNMFDGSKINNDKTRTWKNLMKMNKRT